MTIDAPALTVTPPVLPSAITAQAYSQNFSTTGGVAPYRYAVTAGALPTGLTLSTAGVLSGTPTQGGAFTFTVSATDRFGRQASEQVHITVLNFCPINTA